MSEQKPLTLVTLEYGDARWGGTGGILREDSLVHAGDKTIPLKEYTSQRSILHYIVKPIEGEEETREQALENLLNYLKGATDVERGSLFLVQHAKEGPRSTDYDIYILVGDFDTTYRLQRIGTSIEYAGSAAVITPGKGIDVQTTGDEYKISLDEHMGEINDYIDFEDA